MANGVEVMNLMNVERVGVSTVLDAGKAWGCNWDTISITYTRVSSGVI